MHSSIVITGIKLDLPLQIQTFNMIYYQNINPLVLV